MYCIESLLGIIVHYLPASAHDVVKLREMVHTEQCSAFPKDKPADWDAEQSHAKNPDQAPSLKRFPNTNTSHGEVGFQSNRLYLDFNGRFSTSYCQSKSSILTRAENSFQVGHFANALFLLSDHDTVGAFCGVAVEPGSTVESYVERIIASTAIDLNYNIVGASIVVISNPHHVEVLLIIVVGRHEFFVAIIVPYQHKERRRKDDNML